MTAIPIVWQQPNGISPPEWVLFEMQGELQYKGSMGLQKKGAATTASNVTTFEGLEMGILTPHPEYGPTKPELRIGNLVIPGKLVKLPKPLLVLTSSKVRTTSPDETRMDESSSDNSWTSPQKKRQRLDEENSRSASGKKSRLSLTSSPASTAASTTASTDASSDAGSSDTSSFPSSCLQTVAFIRHKYVFSQRPFSICETGTPTAPSTTTNKNEKSAATTSH